MTGYEEEIPDSLGEQFAFYSTYQPKCFSEVTPYNDLSIICSDAWIAKDKELSQKVVELAQDIAFEHCSKKVKNIKKFYRNYLNDKIKSEKDAKIDLSTLLISAARRDYIDFLIAYDSIRGDQIYKARQGRKGWLLFAPVLNYLLQKSDEASANKKAVYEVLHHVLTPERRARLMEKVKELESEGNKSKLLECFKTIARGIELPKEKDKSEGNMYDPLKDFYKSLDSEEHEHE
ncbi:MAG: hypothetical protein QW666_01135 [Candidatus Woesearchaeota archaeon]